MPKKENSGFHLKQYDFPPQFRKGVNKKSLTSKRVFFIFIFKYVSSMHKIYNYKTYVSSMQQNLFILKGAWN